MKALQELFFTIIDRLGAKTGVAVGAIIALATTEIPPGVTGNDLYLLAGKMVGIVGVAIGFMVYRRQQESENTQAKAVTPLEGGDSK